MKHAELIERLEALTGPDREVDRAIMAEFYRMEQRHIGTTCWDDGHDTCCVGARHMTSVWVDPATDEWRTTALDGCEFTASMDAAVALVERCLPDKSIDLLREAISYLGKRYDWHIRRSTPEQRRLLPVALLIALLRALSHQEPSSGS